MPAGDEWKKTLVDLLKKTGFAGVEIDLAGYRTPSAI
jgi:PP-loop superfamily ATP-utilizing enzyme